MLSLDERLFPNSFTFHSFKMEDCLPKSTDEWTIADLARYNIRVEYQDATTFFGVPHLPDPVLTSDDVLQATDFDQATTDDGFAFLFGLSVVMSPDAKRNEESAFHDFVRVLFRSCGYTGAASRRFTRTKMGICSKAWDGDKHAKVDACILNDKEETILVVQENKWRFDYDLSDPEPQLIAKAITAFDNNKNIPWQELQILPLPRSSESKLMTGITFTGTFPTFYKIPVSKDLFSVTNRGQPPGQETVVHAHIPVVPRHDLRWSEGMMALDNRKIIFSCFEAFKKFVN
jgi:hypothetical protein